MALTRSTLRLRRKTFWGHPVNCMKWAISRYRGQCQDCIGVSGRLWSPRQSCQIKLIGSWPAARWVTNLFLHEYGDVHCQQVFQSLVQIQGYSVFWNLGFIRQWTCLNPFFAYLKMGGLVHLQFCQIIQE